MASIWRLIGTKPMPDNGCHAEARRYGSGGQTQIRDVGAKKSRQGLRRYAVLVRSAFALWVHAAAIDIWGLFHGFALSAAVLLTCDHARAIGMSALLSV